MKIKITEQQYNALLNEGYFDRLGAKVSAEVSSMFKKNSSDEKSKNDKAQEKNYEKLKSYGLDVDNKVKSVIEDLYELYPTPKLEVIDYLHYLQDFLMQNNNFLNLESKIIPLKYVGKHEHYTDKEIAKLQYMASRLRDYIVGVVNNLNRVFSSKKDRQVENYIHFLGEFLNENKNQGHLKSDRFGYTTRIFYKSPKKFDQQSEISKDKIENEPKQQIQPAKKQVTQTQPAKTQTNYPGRTEELRQKMQSRLNTNPYFGK
jgi:basic membrane lipoprotein Med (substrate-binding protein (PBP1-ABC) superfamily)